MQTVFLRAADRLGETDNSFTFAKAKELLRLEQEMQALLDVLIAELVDKRDGAGFMWTVSLERMISQLTESRDLVRDLRLAGIDTATAAVQQDYSIILAELNSSPQIDGARAGAQVGSV